MATKPFNAFGALFTPSQRKEATETLFDRQRKMVQIKLVGLNIQRTIDTIGRAGFILFPLNSLVLFF